MNKTDIYRLYYEKMFDISDWVNEATDENGVNIANFIAGMTEFAQFLIEACDEMDTLSGDTDGKAD